MKVTIVFAIFLVALVAFTSGAPGKGSTKASLQKKPCLKECGDVYKPVCGGDNASKPRSYGSECVLANFNCESGMIVLALVQIILASPARKIRQADFTTTTTPSPSYTRCLNNCLTTQEYNPVCGTDSVTYQNEAKIRCAQRCGKSTEISFRGTCQAL
ncbi:unnamed protein product [Brassicogethes aeneus]|uniref:Kazal-like domain-containing protein n=1 Tax=Brassicogethes aeneus TaxID=1431903 RepID=A0A9P0FGU1_BRAAE|nr:unnamed protein product [Brassicogethes aeneus]